MVTIFTAYLGAALFFLGLYRSSRSERWKSALWALVGFAGVCISAASTVLIFLPHFFSK